ncbi:hypothetical protein BH10BAC2_BH10BAC2_32000 [soil metagenome]
MDLVIVIKKNKILKLRLILFYSAGLTKPSKDQNVQVSDTTKAQ